MDLTAGCPGVSAMDEGLALICGGIGLLALDAVFAVRKAGTAAVALIAGGTAAVAFPDQLWLAAATGAVVAPGLSSSVLGFLRDLAADFSSPLADSGSLLEQTVRVVEALVPGGADGKVEMDGCVWTARSAAPIGAGECAAVERIDGDLVIVRPGGCA